MIKFGETYTLLEDPHGVYRGMMEKYLSSDYRCTIAPPQAEVTQRGNNLLYLNYPPLPKPEINRLVIPTGATRWSYMYLLATTTMRDAIVEESDNVPGSQLLLQYRSEKPGQREADETIRMMMRALTAIPISVRDVNAGEPEEDPVFDETFDPTFAQENNEPEPSRCVATEGLWLIPIVGSRYFWQLGDVGQISGEDFETAEELLTYLRSRFAEEIEVKELHEQYDRVPSVSANDNENAAVVLDSVAWQLGLTLVPRMDRDGNEFILVDNDTSMEMHNLNMQGMGGFDENNRTAIGVPVPVAGDEFVALRDDAFPQLPGELRIQKNATEFETVLRQDLGVLLLTWSNSSLPLRYRWLDDEVTDLGPAAGADPDDDSIIQRIARDYYNRFLIRYDRTFVGQQRWQPVSYTDCVIHEMQPVPLTRIRSIPGNLYPELPSSSGSGGGGDGDCPCVCVTPNMVHPDGFETVRNWTGRLNNNTPWFASGDGVGEIRLIAGSYSVEWDDDEAKWIMDIPQAQIEARSLDGSAANVTSVTGSVMMEFTGVDGDICFTIEFDATLMAVVVPPEPPVVP